MCGRKDSFFDLCDLLRRMLATVTKSKLPPRLERGALRFRELRLTVGRTGDAGVCSRRVVASLGEAGTQGLVGWHFAQNFET